MAGDSRVETDERAARQITALLPNGRTLWFRTAEPLATAVSVGRLAQIAERAGDRRASSSIHQSAAIRRLSETIAADAERLEAARLRRARALRRRIVAGDRTLDTRLAKARDEFRSALDKQLKIDRENVRRLRRRDMWDKILIAVSLPLFAAYGQPGNLRGTHNVTLAVLLLVWLAGDHVVEAVFGSQSPKSPYALHDADAWSYLAPIASLLAGWWLLGDRQHERFVTGITTVKLEPARARTESGTVFYRFAARVDLHDRIAKDHVADFETLGSAPAVATVGGLRLSAGGKAIDPRIEGLSARVKDGVLRFTFQAVSQTPAPPATALGEVDIAWMVDTEKRETTTPAQ